MPDSSVPDWVSGRNQCVSSISSEPEIQPVVQGRNLVVVGGPRRQSLPYHVEDLEFDEFRMCLVGQ